MKRRFQLLIEGTVESDPDTARIEDLPVLDEMKAAVEASFKPGGILWGVDYTTFEVTLIKPEEGDSDNSD